MMRSQSSGGNPGLVDIIHEITVSVSAHVNRGSNRGPRSSRSITRGGAATAVLATPPSPWGRGLEHTPNVICNTY